MRPWEAKSQWKKIFNLMCKNLVKFHLKPSFSTPNSFHLVE